MIDKPTLLFDSECSLCLRFKQAIERLDGEKKINYISLHDPQIKQIFPELKIEDLLKVIHLVSTDGQIYQGPEVITQLVKIFPSVSHMAWMLETDIGKKTLDFFYDKVNELRNSKLSFCKKCGDD